MMRPILSTVGSANGFTFFCAFPFLSSRNHFSTSVDLIAKGARSPQRGMMRLTRCRSWVSIGLRWKTHEPAKQNRGQPEPSQHGCTLYNTSPLGGLRDANGLIYIRVGGCKLLCFEQFPESIFCVP